MAQHFLLSAAARTVSLKQILRMEEAEAWAMFCSIRWPETEGAPVCPQCGCPTCWACPRPNGAPRFRCSACRRDFSPTFQPDVGHPVRLSQAGDPRLPGGGRNLLR